ncbi:hypothetical protein [Saccharopolyspora elongata]|uniref:Tetratricopeptide repeat protein n=1 Tax=Saccharopolyspora elongata TaxID=2530387 RepID=A0A4R4Z412_9PSEU|nr:hypothetical protein [Saccharopolyspora elongata]TDD52733.1 hypothetical protein E1288_11010 [Saccharopolyspora elongata]
MSDAAKTITDLLDEADQTPYGAPERALLDQAIALAEEAGHEELAYAARMRLVTSAKMTGDTDGMLAAFAWCLGKFDSDPVRFPSELTGAADSWDLLWYFKWMASTVTGSLQFSSTQLEAVLADMDRRYTEAGVGRSGVVQSLFSSSVETGRLADAERFRLELEALPRDEYSHCEACARSEFADYQQTIGDDAAAVALFDEIQEQQLSCGEEPEGNEADSLLPLLRLGRGEDAAAAHMRGYRAARGNPDNIAMIARHWVFCAVTGNEARGLALLERHIRDLMVDPMNDRQKFAGSCAAAVLLDAVTRAGQGSTPVRHSDDPVLAPLLGDHAGPWTAADLAATFWAAADRLAAAFDARNGNDFHGRQVARSRALADERYDVPLESSTYTPVVAAEVTTTEPTTAEDWLRRAGERAATGDHDGVMDAVERALAAGGQEVAADAYRVAVQSLVATDQHEQAAKALADRGKALRELGRDDYADVEDQVGLALYGTATAADLPAFDAAIEDARARAGRDVLADLLATRADVLGTEERVDEALRDAQEAAALLVPVAEPTIAERQLRNHAVLHRTFLLMMAQRFEEATGSIDDLLRDAGIGRQTRQVGLRMKAQALATRGRLDEALQAAEEALSLQVAIGGARLVLNAAGLSAQLLSDLGRDAEAAARMRFALRQAESAGVTGAFAEKFRLGQYLTWSDQADEAIEVIDEVYRGESESGAPPAALGETMLGLGVAALRGNQPGVAYGAFQRGLGHAVEAEHLPLQVGLATQLARMLVQFRDDEAIEVIDAVLERARAAGDGQSALRMLNERGLAKANLGDESAIADFDAVIAEANAAGEAWLAADATDSKARELAGAERHDEAVRCALAAADGYAASGDANAGANSEFLAAQILRDQGRADEALACYTSAIERAEAPALVERLTEQRAEYLAELGRSE